MVQILSQLSHKCVSMIMMRPFLMVCSQVAHMRIEQCEHRLPTMALQPHYMMQPTTIKAITCKEEQEEVPKCSSLVITVPLITVPVGLQQNVRPQLDQQQRTASSHSLQSCPLLQSQCFSLWLRTPLSVAAMNLQRTLRTHVFPLP